jgi:GT2 family glycosyltransferase
MIALVTVTYNSESVLEDFLKSVRRQSGAVRLYVVDNDSSDGTVAVLGAFEGIDLVVLPQATNGGIAVGNNVGIRAAMADGCEWIVLINNDTEFGPDLVAGLVATASDVGAGVVVPSIKYHDQPDQVWFEAARYAKWRGSIPVTLPPAERDSVSPIECSCTCCALVHHSVFDRVGLMDENYFVYWDDTDFFLRCHKAAIPMVLDTRLSVLHKVSSLTGGGESDFSQRERIKNRVYFIRKHHGRATQLLGLSFTASNVLKLIAFDTGRLRRLRLLRRAFADGCRIPVSRSS